MHECMAAIFREENVMAVMFEGWLASQRACARVHGLRPVKILP